MGKKCSLIKRCLKKGKKDMNNFCFNPKTNVLMYPPVGVFSGCSLGFLYHASTTGAFEC